MCVAAANNNGYINESMATAGILYCIGKANIMNVSWSFLIDDLTLVSSALRTFVASKKDNTIRDGSMVICSVGNGGLEGVRYPANKSFTIAVTNVDVDDTLMVSSSYGRESDLSAGGQSTVFLTPITSGSVGYNSNGYRVYDDGGTSVATAIVTGVLSLVLSHYPEYFTVADLKGILLRGVDNIDAKNYARVGQIGVGRINAYKALVEADKLVKKRNVMF